MNQGNTVLTKSDHSSIEIIVRLIERMRFLPDSAKHVTNVPCESSNKRKALDSTSNLIQFQSVDGFYQSQNCSSSFEKAFQAKNINEVSFISSNIRGVYHVYTLYMVYTLYIVGITLFAYKIYF